MSNIFSDKRKLFGTILGLIMFAVTVVSITYAYYSWRSSNTIVTFNIQDNIFFCETNINSSVSNLSPVNDYRQGTYQSFIVKNIGRQDTTFSLTMNVTNISSDVIKDESFKYRLMLDPTGGSKNCVTASDCTLVGEGNFSNIQVGMNTLIQSINLPNNSKYQYYFFMYLDGSMSNPTGIQSQSMTSTLGVCDIYATLDVSYIKLSSSTYQMGGNCASASPDRLKLTADSTYGTAKAYGSGTAVGLPTPTRSNTTISFNSNASGVSNPSNKTVSYSFGGWYNNNNFTGSAITNSTNVTTTENQTLYAKWTPNTPSSGSITLPSISRAGYTFDGWYTAASGGTRVGGVGDSYLPTDCTKTLYAHWTAISRTIDIRKDNVAWSNSGVKVCLRAESNLNTDVLCKTASATVTFTSGNDGIVDSNIRYHVFVGKDSNHKTDLVDSGVTIYQNEDISPVNYYTLTVNGNHVNTLKVNGTTVSSVAVLSNYPHPITGTADTGYSFNSWSKTAGSGTVTFGSASQASTTANVTGNSATITANATINSYTITLKAGKGVSTLTADGWTNSPAATITKSYNYNSTINLANIVTPNFKAGYSGVSYTKTSGSGTLSGSSFTVGAGVTTITINATTLAAPTCSISGGTTKIYNYQDTGLTATNATSYATGVTLKYQFGYAADNNTAFSNYSSQQTSNTYSVTKALYRGTRYYGVKITATGDGGLTNNCTTATGSGTAMTLKNKKLTFNATANGGTLSGTGTLYIAYDNASVYTGATNTTTGTIPSASKGGYTFDGWYTTQTTGGVKVINANGTLVTSATDWVTSSKWTNTSVSDATLYARFVTNSYTVSYASTAACPLGSGYSSQTVNFGDVINKANPTCTGYTFDGWTLTGGDTSTAKYGTTNNPTTAWVNKNKGTYFKNLASTAGATPTLTANWVAKCYTVTVKAGAGISSLARTGWTGSGTGTLTKELCYGTTDDLSGFTPTYKNGYSGRSNVKTSGAGSISGNTFTVGDGVTTITVNATAIETPVPTVKINDVTTLLIKVYGLSNSTLSGSVSNTYDSSISVSYTYYYDTSSSGSYTNTQSSTISADSHKGIRYYKAKAIATGEGGLTSNAMSSNHVSLKLIPTKYTLDANSCGTFQGGGTTSDYYVYKGETTLYSDENGATTTTWPTFNTLSYKDLNGWYTLSSSGNKVLKNDGSIFQALSGYTTASAYVSTKKRTLYAQCSNKTFSTTIHYNSNATAGSFTAATVGLSCVAGDDGTCAVAIPSAVISSNGKYNSIYAGLINVTGSMVTGVGGTVITLSASSSSDYYAKYTSPITVNWYDSTVSNVIEGSSSDRECSSGIKLYRNEFFTSDTAMSTITSTSATSTTQASTLSLTGLLGTLLGITPNANTSTGYMAVNNSGVINSGDTTYYAVCQNTQTITYYYNSNTTLGSFTTATTTNSRSRNYICAPKTISGTSYLVRTVSYDAYTIPDVVRNSVGMYNSPYYGMATGWSRMDNVGRSSSTRIYATYSQPLTIYYPDTSGGVSSSNESLYRNEYFTNVKSGSEAMGAVTSVQINETQATNSDISLPNLRGTLLGITPNANTSTGYMAVNNSGVINSGDTTYYAVTSVPDDNATIYYNSNTTAGEFTPSTATITGTSTRYCVNTSSQGTQGSTINLSSVPTTVTNSVGKWNTPYHGLASGVNSMNLVSSMTTGGSYYAVYGAGETTGGTGAVDSNVNEYYSENNNSSGYSLSQSFDYTGDIQTFTAPRAGYYKLETWGAEGGGDSTYPGGKGGYSSGIVHLNANETVYVVVGGKGNMTSTKVVATMLGGYNGGGNAFGHTDKYVGSGGGATHIAKATGVLSSLSSNQSSILIVAGGGGGGATQTAAYYGYGGAGGGINGYAGSVYGTTSVPVGAGGTQTSGGTGTPAAAFGIGGSSTGNGTAGGGGYYGGGAGKYYAGGGGGSGYIGGVTNGVIIGGDDIMPNPDGTTATGHEDNGYARITYYADNISELMNNYSYTGERQEFSAPEKGIYRLQLWGAQGGLGGLGGYTAGNLSLNSSEKLYMYVGQYGPANLTITNVGGWNGGGYSGNNTGAYSYGGGGATDARLTNGSAVTTWNDATSLRSRIMIAGGGGGNFTVNTDSITNTKVPGVGGNLTGGNAGGTYNSTNPGGGTQTGPGAAASTAKQGLYGSAVQTNVSGWGGGGGGGHWGGSMGHGKSGAGGSSYISGYTGSVAVASASSNAAKSGCANGTTDISCSYHYSNKIFTDTVMINGANNMPTYDGVSDMTGNSGNGYAKINKVGRNIYRNEFFTSPTGMNTVLSNSSTGTSNITTSNGTGNSPWYGYAIDGTTTRSYSNVSAAAQSTNLDLYSIYQMQINYQKGSNVSAIGDTSGNCLMSYSDYSCNSTTPSITPNNGYSENGWSKTQDDINYGFAPSTSVPFSISNQTYFGNAKANDITVFYDPNDDFANNIFTSINTGSGGGATTSFDSTNKIITINGAQTQSGWLQKITTSFASNDAYKVSLEYVSGSYTINSGSSIGFRFETRKSNGADISKRNALSFDWPTSSEDDDIQYLAISPESVAEAQILYIWMQCSSSKITFNNYKVRLKVEKISYRTETFGSTYHLPTTNPTWNEHTLIGWKDENEASVDNNTIITNPDDPQIIFGDWKPNIIVTYSSGNILTGLDDCETTQGETGTTGVHYMEYSISDGVVTVTNTRGAADGWGYTTGRVFLEANHTYRFNAETDGTWSTTEGSGQVEAYLMLNGRDSVIPACGSTNFCHMASNENFEFTPLITGEYWLRLDVNENGGNYHFWNIHIEEIVDRIAVPYNANYVLPSNNPTRNDNQFDGWYTEENGGGTHVTSSTLLLQDTDHTIYADWNRTYHVFYGGIPAMNHASNRAWDSLYNVVNSHDNGATTWNAFKRNTDSDAKVLNGTWGDDYLQFNGTNTAVDLGFAASINSTNSAFTVEAIIMVDSYSTGNSMILANCENGGIDIFVTSIGRIAFEYWNGSAYQITYGPSLILGKKYHVAATFNAGVVKLYVNGKLVKQESKSGTSIKHPASSVHYYLGCNPSTSGCSGGYFKGKIYGAGLAYSLCSEAEIMASAGKDVTSFDQIYLDLPIPNRGPYNNFDSGYTFDGWYDSVNLTNPVTSSTTFDDIKNITIYAKWRADLNTTFYDDEYNVPISVTNGTANGVTYSWNADKHYLTLNGKQTATINNLIVSNMSIGLGDEWDIVLRHVSGTYTKSANSFFTLDAQNGTANVATRSFRDCLYPVSGTTTCTYVPNSSAASTATRLKIQLYTASSGGIVFKNYVMQVDIVKRKTTYYSGTSWNDLARKKTGVVNNGTFVAPSGGDDGYLQFNGTSTWANLGTITGISRFTVEVDLIVDSLTTSSEQWFVGNPHDGGFGIRYSTANGVQRFNACAYVSAWKCGIDTTVNRFSLNDNDVITTGVRYRVVGVYDGSAVNTYVKDMSNSTNPYVLTSTVSVTGSVGNPTNSTVMAVGTNPNGSSAASPYFNGKIYSVKISNKALAQSALETNIVDSSTVRYYKVDSDKTHYTVLPEISSDNYDVPSGANSVRGKFDAWYTATTNSSNMVSAITKVPYNYDHSVFASYIGNAVQVRYHLNGGAWGNSTNGSLGVYEYNDDPNDLVVTHYNGNRDYQSYEYGSTVNLSDWNNKDFINIKKTGQMGANGAQWCTQPDGTGTCYNQATDYSTNEFCDASSHDCIVDLYVNWTRSFTCAAQGGTTSYKGKNWYTVSNSNNTCELLLNDSVGSGKYSAVTGTDNPSYSIIKSYSDAGGTLEDEMTDYVTSLDTIPNVDSTGKGLNSKLYWSSSGKIFVPSWVSYSYNTIYADFGFHNKVGQSSGMNGYLIHNSTNPKTNPAGLVDVSDSISKYTLKNGNQSSVNKTYGYSNKYSMNWSVWGPSGGNGTSSKVRLVLETGSFTDQSVGGIYTRTATSWIKGIVCGGQYGGKTVTWSPVSSTKYHYKYTGTGNDQTYSYNENVYAHPSCGSGVSGCRPDWTDGRNFTFAGSASANPYTDAQKKYDYNAASNCTTYKEFTISDRTESIHYRPHIIVKK